MVVIALCVPLVMMVLLFAMQAWEDLVFPPREDREHGASEPAPNPTDVS
ncbi:hypothetical protein ABZ070_00300 [Streptomyces sp. NPDC006283]